MRIVCINGSLRANGNTARALSILLTDLEAQAAGCGEPLELERVSLGACRVETCRGCRSCFDRGEDKCTHDDDLGGLAERINGADALILASPVYVNDASGAMKTLIDRLASICHRPALARVVAFALATTGGSPCRHTLGTLTGALLSWGACTVGTLGLTTGALQQSAEVESHHGAALRRAARTVFTAVRSRRPEKPSFVSLMMFALQQKSWGRVDPRRVDYRYWKESGFLDKGRTLFIPHPTNYMLLGAARATGRVLAAVFGG